MNIINHIILQKARVNQSETLEKMEDIIPTFPEMCDVETRLETLRKWPKEKPNIKNMADSGLYYIGVKDIVACFTCGGLLGNWKNDDDPMVEHKKFFPYCEYIYYMTKNKDSILLQTREISPKYEIREKYVSKTFGLVEEMYTSDKIKNQPRMKISRNNNHKSESESQKENPFLCKICMNREMCIVFQPCGHLVACNECVKQLCNCPLCRKVISSKIKTFIG